MAVFRPQLTGLKNQMSYMFREYWTTCLINIKKPCICMYAFLLNLNNTFTWNASIFNWIFRVVDFHSRKYSKDGVSMVHIFVLYLPPFQKIILNATYRPNKAIINPFKSRDIWSSNFSHMMKKSLAPS